MVKAKRWLAALAAAAALVVGLGIGFVAMGFATLPPSSTMAAEE